MKTTYWLQESHNQYGEFTRSTLWAVSAGMSDRWAKHRRSMGRIVCHAPELSLAATKPREVYRRLRLADVLPRASYYCNKSGETLMPIAF